MKNIQIYIIFIILYFYFNIIHDLTIYLKISYLIYEGNQPAILIKK